MLDSTICYDCCIFYHFGNLKNIYIYTNWGFCCITKLVLMLYMWHSIWLWSWDEFFPSGIFSKPIIFKLSFALTLFRFHKFKISKNFSNNKLNQHWNYFVIEYNDLLKDDFKVLEIHIKILWWLNNLANRFFFNM